MQTFTHSAPSSDRITKIDCALPISPTAVSLASEKSNTGLKQGKSEIGRDLVSTGDRQAGNKA